MESQPNNQVRIVNDERQDPLIAIGAEDDASMRAASQRSPERVLRICWGFAGGDDGYGRAGTPTRATSFENRGSGRSGSNAGSAARLDSHGAR